MNRAESDPEILLARELLSGNMDAIDEFVSRFQNKIFNYSYLMCGHREDAEEVAQDTLMKVFENLDQLREPERVKSWVFRIARNNCLMKRRKSMFAPAEVYSLDEMVQEDGASRPRFDPKDTAEFPDIQAFRAELRDALQTAIRNLPPLYRSVMLLRDVEGLSTDETAEILDISADTVKTRLHRARLALRTDLEPYLSNRMEAAL